MTPANNKRGNPGNGGKNLPGEKNQDFTAKTGGAGKSVDKANPAKNARRASEKSLGSDPGARGMDKPGQGEGGGSGSRGDADSDLDPEARRSDNADRAVSSSKGKGIFSKRKSGNSKGLFSRRDDNVNVTGDNAPGASDSTRADGSKSLPDIAAESFSGKIDLDATNKQAVQPKTDTEDFPKPVKAQTQAKATPRPKKTPAKPGTFPATSVKSEVPVAPKVEHTPLEKTKTIDFEDLKDKGGKNKNRKTNTLKDAGKAPADAAMSKDSTPKPKAKAKAQAEAQAVKSAAAAKVDAGKGAAQSKQDAKPAPSADIKAPVTKARNAKPAEPIAPVKDFHDSKLPGTKPGSDSGHGRQATAKTPAPAASDKKWEPVETASPTPKANNIPKPAPADTSKQGFTPKGWDPVETTHTPSSQSDSKDHTKPATSTAAAANAAAAQAKKPATQTSQAPVPPKQPAAPEAKKADAKAFAAPQTGEGTRVGAGVGTAGTGRAPRSEDHFPDPVAPPAAKVMGADVDTASRKKRHELSRQYGAADGSGVDPRNAKARAIAAQTDSDSPVSDGFDDDLEGTAAGSLAGSNKQIKITEKAMSKVIDAAIRSVPGTIETSTGMDKLTGRSYPRYDMKLGTGGDAIAIDAFIAVGWPAPVAAVAEKTRETIVTWIQDMTDVPVVEANVTVAQVLHGYDRVTRHELDTYNPHPTLGTIRVVQNAPKVPIHTKPWEITPHTVTGELVDSIKSVDAPKPVGLVDFSAGNPPKVTSPKVAEPKPLAKIKVNEPGPLRPIKTDDPFPLAKIEVGELPAPRKIEAPKPKPPTKIVTRDIGELKTVEAPRPKSLMRIEAPKPAPARIIEAPRPRRLDPVETHRKPLKKVHEPRPKPLARIPEPTNHRLADVSAPNPIRLRDIDVHAMPKPAKPEARPLRLARVTHPEPKKLAHPKTPKAKRPKKVTTRTPRVITPKAPAPLPLADADQLLPAQKPLKPISIEPLIVTPTKVVDK